MASTIIQKEKNPFVLPISLHFQCLIAILLSTTFLHAQVITQATPGSEYAHYTSDDLRFVLGAFNQNYDGHSAIGGRDVFLLNRNTQEVDIWSGPGVEQLISVKNAHAQEPLLLVRYFGSLKSRSGQAVETNTGNAYVIADITADKPFLFNLELSIGQLQSAEQKGDTLKVLVKSESGIYLNDSLVWESQSEALVLLQINRNGWYSAQTLFSSSGEYRIIDMQSKDRSLFLVGRFLGPLRLGLDSINTPTPYFDGIYLHWDLDRQQPEDIRVASGVFDVRLTQVTVTESDTLLLGEYFGNVSLEDGFLEDPMLNTSLFLYSFSLRQLKSIGGQNEEQSINMHAVANGLLITGNFRGRFMYEDLMEECQGANCGFFLKLDDELHGIAFRKFYSTERQDLFSSYVFSNAHFCGAYQGIYNNTAPISNEEDWFCEQIELTTSNYELPKQVDETFLYPNPIKEGAIHLTKPWSNARYILFDPFGNILQKAPWTGRIDVRNLPEGTYFLRLINKNASEMFTFKKVN